VQGLYIAIIAALILGVLNILVKPVLVLLTLPITIVTLGLFIFIINAFLFWFVASFIDGFTVDGFIPALLGSLIVSIISAVGNKLVK
jgi:putative membrane protein